MLRILLVLQRNDLMRRLRFHRAGLLTILDKLSELFFHDLLLLECTGR